MNKTFRPGSDCIEFECDDPAFNYAQPRKDLTPSHTAPHGGRNLVLEYCETSLLDVLQTLYRDIGMISLSFQTVGILHISAIISP